MVTDEYIHILEAAEVYGRTRQTFYNYVNKGLIDTKKINNKLYLRKADIEKLVNDYIELLPNEAFSSYSAVAGAHQDLSWEYIPPQEMAEKGPVTWYGIGEEAVTQLNGQVEEDNDYTENHSYSRPTSKSQRPSGPYANIQSLHNLQDDLLRLHKQAFELKDLLHDEILNTKNEIMFDTKNALFAHEQKLQSTLNLQNKEIEHIQTHLISQETSTNLYQRKLRFWLGYCGFVAVNGLVLWTILW